MDLTTDLLAASDRQRLIQAMTELCASQGYAAVRAEQVAERAELGLEVFEREFSGGKAECTLAAVNAILGEVLGAVSAGYSPDRLEWESYLRGTKGILELMAAYPSSAHLCYITARQEANDPMLREVYRTGSQALSVLLERLWQYSSAPRKPQSAPRAALGAAEAVIRREIVAGNTEQIPRLLPDFIYMATVPFLGQEEAIQLARRARELLQGGMWGQGQIGSTG
jgi:AcrR family transcriptional regulator